MISQASSSIYSNVVLPTVTNPTVVTSARILCAVPALEIALQAFKDLADLFQPIQYSNTANEQEKSLKENEHKQKQAKRLNAFIEHAIVSVFLGISALNLFTGSAVIGNLGFAIYAKKKWKNECTRDNPSTAILIAGIALDYLTKNKKKFIKKTYKVVKKGIKKTYSAIKLVVQKIKGIFKAIFKAIGKCSRVIKKCVKAPLKFIGKTFKIGSKIIAKIAAVSVKIFAAIFKHPYVAVAVLAITACVIGTLMLPGVTGAIAGALGSAAKGIAVLAKTMICSIPQVLIGAVKVIGTALSFVPSILSNLGQALATIASKSVGPLGSLLVGSVKVLGSVLSFLPNVLSHLIFGIVNIARFILRI